MKKITFLFILVCTFLISSCTKKEDIPSSSEIRNQELQKILVKAKSKTDAPSIMLSVARPSKNWSWSSAVGKANIGSSESASTSHRFRVASVTKMFTAVAIMLLVEENKMNLEDLISIHLSPTMMANISSKVPNANTITVKSLLNHTSSLGEYTGTPEFAVAALSNPRSSPTREQVIDIGLEYSPAGNMGTWHYSNVGYNLLSIIIEKVSGKPYRTFIKERILDPLKMNNTYFPYDEFMMSPFITPYFTTTPPPTESNNWSIFNCNWGIGTGDLVSSLNDLQIFMQALMQGKIVTNQSLQIMKSNTVPSSYTGLPNETYGLGLFMCEDPDFIGHSGDLIGIYTNVYYFKSIDTYMVSSINLNDQNEIVFEMLGEVNNWIKNNDK